jgi:Flp pilus assembly protein TadD
VRIAISTCLFFLLVNPAVCLPQDAFTRAEELYKAGKIQQAAVLYSRVEASDPKYRQALVRLGTIYYATERPALAEDRFRTALQLQESADVLTLLAGAQFNQEKFDDAYKSAKRALELDAKHTKAFAALGMIYTALKNWPDADAAYTEALRLDPKDSTTWYLQGRSYYLRNEFEKARQAFESALKLNPQGIRVYENLALTLDLLGDPKAAERIFEDGIQKNRKLTRPEGRIYIAYGSFLFKQDRLEESRRALEEGVRLEPRNPEALYELGKTLFGMKELKEAAAQGEIAVRVGKPDYRVHFLLSRIYTALGDELAASRHAEQAAKLADAAQSSAH